MRRHRRTLGLLAAATVTATLVAACGSSAKQANSAASTASTAAAADDFGLKYTGGVAGKADTSKTPITVGYVNEEGAVPAFPEATSGIEAAVKYINTELGGIGGHPIVLEKCLVQTEEDGQKCGTQLANDDKVKFVVTGTLVLGNKSLYSVLSGKKPVLIGNPVVADDFVTPDTFAFTPGSPGVIQGMAVFIAKHLQTVHKVAVIYNDNPGGKIAAEQLFKPVLVKLGVPNVTTVPISDTATAPDVASAIQAAGGDKADVLVPLVTVQSCIATYDALQSLGISPQVVTTGLCYGTPMIQHLNGQVPEGWFYGGYGYSYFLPDDASGMSTYLAKIKQYGPSKVEFTGFAGPTFATLMTATQLLNKIGAENVTPDSLRTAIKGFKGPQMLWVGPMACGSNPVFTSLCGSQMGFEQFKAGKWLPVADGLNDQPIDPTNP